MAEMRGGWLLSAGLAIGSVARAAQYQVVDLGVAGEARAINNQGHVAILLQSSAGAAIWDGTTVRQIGAGDPRDIDENDEVVGYTLNSTDGNRHAFLYSAGQFTTLPVGGITGEAFGINDLGQVVGGWGSFFNGSYEHAFLYDHGTVVDLGSGTAQDINNSSVVVGKTTGLIHPFVYQNGIRTNLTWSGGPWAINEAGWFVGNSNDAFLYKDGVVTSLGTLSQAAFSVNASGQVVGRMDNGDWYLYSNGALTPLNDLVGPGWTVTSAYDINDRGEIAAGVADASGHSHAAILVPLPEPVTAGWLVGLMSIRFLHRAPRA